MADEPHARGNGRVAACAVDDVVHEDVVFGDVEPGRRVGRGAAALGTAAGTRRSKRRASRTSAHLRRDHLSPSSSRSASVVSGKLTSATKAIFDANEIVLQMRRRIELGHALVERGHRTEVELDAPLQRALDLEEVTVELLEDLLEAREHPLERGAGRREFLGDQLLAIGVAAVFGAPRRRHLLLPALEARAIDVAQRRLGGAWRRTAAPRKGSGESASRCLQYGRTNRTGWPTRKAALVRAGRKCNTHWADGNAPGNSGRQIGRVL